VTLQPQVSCWHSTTAVCVCVRMRACVSGICCRRLPAGSFIAAAGCQHLGNVPMVPWPSKHHRPLHSLAITVLFMVFWCLNRTH
jgi:hypothetical protein